MSPLIGWVANKAKIRKEMPRKKRSKENTGCMSILFDYHVLACHCWSEYMTTVDRYERVNLGRNWTITVGCALVDFSRFQCIFIEPYWGITSLNELQQYAHATRIHPFRTTRIYPFRILKKTKQRIYMNLIRIYMKHRKRPGVGKQSI